MLRDSYNWQSLSIILWNYFLLFTLNLKEELTIILLILSIVLTSIKIIQVSIKILKKEIEKNE